MSPSSGPISHGHRRRGQCRRGRDVVESACVRTAAAAGRSCSSWPWLAALAVVATVARLLVRSIGRRRGRRPARAHRWSRSPPRSSPGRPRPGAAVVRPDRRRRSSAWVGVGERGRLACRRAVVIDQVGRGGPARHRYRDLTAERRIPGQSGDCRRDGCAHGRGGDRGEDQCSFHVSLLGCGCDHESRASLVQRAIRRWH